MSPVKRRENCALIEDNKKEIISKGHHLSNAYPLLNGEGCMLRLELRFCYVLSRSIMAFCKNSTLIYKRASTADARDVKWVKFLSGRLTLDV